MERLNFRRNKIEKSKASKAYENSLNAFIFLCIVISFCFISFSYWFIDVKVVGPSMQPTVNAQWENTIEGQKKQDTAYIKVSSDYKNGDIIVVKSDEDSYIIKRLIASAGDKINIIQNLDSQIEIYLNDYLLNEDYVVYKSGLENTFDNFSHLRTSKPEFFDINGNLVVPDGFVFYLGDNRGQSLDCSYYGPQEVEKVVGRVDIIVPYGKTLFEYLWQELWS